MGSEWAVNGSERVVNGWQMGSHVVNGLRKDSKWVVDGSKWVVNGSLIGSTWVVKGSRWVVNG